MSFRGFLPLANRVLVRRMDAVTKTTGGIMLPQSSIKKLNIAEVLSVGEGFRKEVNFKSSENVFCPEGLLKNLGIIL